MRTFIRTSISAAMILIYHFCFPKGNAVYWMAYFILLMAVYEIVEGKK